MVDSLRRDHEPASDLRVGRAGRHEGEHLGLARREARRPGARRRPRPARDPPHAGGPQAPAQVQGGARGAVLVEHRQRVEPHSVVGGVAQRVGSLVGTAESRPERLRAAPVSGDRARVRLRRVGRGVVERARAPQPEGELAARPHAAALGHADTPTVARPRRYRRRPRRATRSLRAQPRPAPAAAAPGCERPGARPRRACRPPHRRHAAPGAARARSAPDTGSRRAARRGRAMRGRPPRPPASRRSETQVRARAEGVLHVPVEVRSRAKASARSRSATTRGSSRRRTSVVVARLTSARAAWSSWPRRPRARTPPRAAHDRARAPGRRAASFPTFVSACATVSRSSIRRASRIARVPSVIASSLPSPDIASCDRPLSAIASSRPSGCVSSTAIARSPAAAASAPLPDHQRMRESQRRSSPTRRLSPAASWMLEQRAARLQRTLRPAAQVRLDGHALERLRRAAGGDRRLPVLERLPVPAAQRWPPGGRRSEPRDRVGVAGAARVVRQPRRVRVARLLERVQHHAGPARAAGSAGSRPRPPAARGRAGTSSAPPFRAAGPRRCTRRSPRRRAAVSASSHSSVAPGTTAASSITARASGRARRPAERPPRARSPAPRRRWGPTAPR